MTDYVLVHGMWHGGWCWKKVTPTLRAAGHEVYVPTLTGVGERAHLRHMEIDLHTHIQDVIGVIEYEDLHDVILVGHSLSGFMAPAIADRIPERIAHIVNLDGLIPVEGKSFKDLLPGFFEDFRQRGGAAGDEWWSPPISEWTFGVAGADLEWMQSKLTPHPLRTWLTPISFTNTAARAIPRTFIHCTEGNSLEQIGEEEKKCLEGGWRYRQLTTGHDPMISAPQTLVELLLELV